MIPAVVYVLLCLWAEWCAAQLVCTALPSSFLVRAADE